MFSNLIKTSVLSVAALVASVPATATDSVVLSGIVQLERVVTEDGKARKVLAAPEGVVPGDRLLFTTSYENSGGEPVENFVVTNPLPTAIRLAEADAAFQVSVDGGATFGDLGAIKIEDAEAGARAAEARDVTHIRWTLERLDPGAKGTLNYYGIVR